MSGYRSVSPLPTDATDDAARRLWWKRTTEFWQLDLHHDRGDDSCDDLFLTGEATLHRWTADREAVVDALRSS